MEKETQGSLGESLKLYRQAYRVCSVISLANNTSDNVQLDDRVDKEYKDKYFPRPPQLTGKGKKPGTAVPDPPVPLAGLSTAHHSLPNRPLGVSGLIASFAGLRIQPPAAASLTNAPGEDEPLETDQPLEDVFSPLSTIPSELVLHILRDLALTDFASFARTAQACKSLCYMVCTEQGIYRDVCARVYARQVWDWVVTVSGSPLYRLDTEPAATLYQPDAEQYADENAPDPDSDEALARLLPSDESELAHYDNSWRTMLRLRPRIRYNGVYISTCNYQRPGGASATAVTWNSPVHIITYYRYLRFFPDGTVLSLLTTHEPADVVYSFSKSSTDSASWAKYLSRGRWRLDRDGRVEVETIPPAGMERYLFRMQLRVARVGRAGAKKLLWEGFWSWNRLTEDLAEFTGRNDRPFFFSRVGTVDREMATVGV